VKIYYEKIRDHVTNIDRFKELCEKEREREREREREKERNRQIRHLLLFSRTTF